MSQQWKPGVSGNPNGRPRGSGEVARMREAISERLPEVLDVLVRRALDGDISAARLLIDRVIPSVRPQDLPIRLPALEAGSFTDKSNEVLRAITDEKIDLSQGATLLTSIANLARITEVDELTNRVSALEERVKCQNS